MPSGLLRPARAGRVPERSGTSLYVSLISLRQLSSCSYSSAWPMQPPDGFSDTAESLLQCMSSISFSRFAYLEKVCPVRTVLFSADPESKVRPVQSRTEIHSGFLTTLFDDRFYQRRISFPIFHASSIVHPRRASLFCIGEYVCSSQYLLDFPKPRALICIILQIQSPVHLDHDAVHMRVFSVIAQRDDASGKRTILQDFKAQ